MYNDEKGFFKNILICIAPVLRVFEPVVCKNKSSDAQHDPPYIFFPMNHVSIKKWLQFRKNGPVVILVGVRLETFVKR